MLGGGLHGLLGACAGLLVVAGGGFDALGEHLAHRVEAAHVAEQVRGGDGLHRLQAGRVGHRRQRRELRLSGAQGGHRGVEVLRARSGGDRRDVGRRDLDGRVLPVPETGEVDLLGRVGPAEYGLGEDALGGDGDRVGHRRPERGVAGLAGLGPLLALLLAAEVPPEAEVVAGGGDRLGVQQGTEQDRRGVRTRRRVRVVGEDAAERQLVGVGPDGLAVVAAVVVQMVQDRLRHVPAAHVEAERCDVGAVAGLHCRTEQPADGRAAGVLGHVGRGGGGRGDPEVGHARVHRQAQPGEAATGGRAEPGVDGEQLVGASEGVGRTLLHAGAAGVAAAEDLALEDHLDAADSGLVVPDVDLGRVGGVGLRRGVEGYRRLSLHGEEPEDESVVQKCPVVPAGG